MKAALILVTIGFSIVLGTLGNAVLTLSSELEYMQREVVTQGVEIDALMQENSRLIQISNH